MRPSTEWVRGLIEWLNDSPGCFMARVLSDDAAAGLVLWSQCFPMAVSISLSLSRKSYLTFHNSSHYS